MSIHTMPEGEENTYCSYLRTYLAARPLFLSLLRAKEAMLYHSYFPLRGPVLDVGCGDGFFTRTVFGSLDEGIDIRESRINESRRDGGYRIVREYDGITFPYKAHTFSTVISNCVLEHIPDVEHILAQMARVVKKNGKILVTVMAKPWEENLFGSLIFGHSYKTFMRRKQVHCNLFTDAQWRAAFAHSGLRVVTCIGYLSPSQCRLLDVCHYLSVPSLLSYLLIGKWVLFPGVFPYSYRFFCEKMIPLCDPSESGALFYELESR